MPLYNLPAIKSGYERLDTKFLNQLLEKRQARDDSVRATYSKMYQTAAGEKYHDEAARQAYLRQLDDRWTNVIDKNAGNMSNAYQDVLTNVEQAKASPYQNLNKRQLEAIKEQEDLKVEYGAEYIDTSSGVYDPIWDPQGNAFRDVSTIQSGALKADPYEQNLEVMVQNLAPEVIQKFIPGIQGVPGSREYLQTVSTYLKQLSPEQLRAFSNDSSIQQAFLANNPTALRDTRWINPNDRSKGRYRDMFGDKDSLGNYIYGNIADEQRNEYKETRQLHTNRSYLQDRNHALAMKRQKQQQDFDVVNKGINTSPGMSKVNAGIQTITPDGYSKVKTNLKEGEQNMKDLAIQRRLLLYRVGKGMGKPQGVAEDNKSGNSWIPNVQVSGQATDDEIRNLQSIGSDNQSNETITALSELANVEQQMVETWNLNNHYKSIVDNVNNESNTSFMDLDEVKNLKLNASEKIELLKLRKIPYDIWTSAKYTDKFRDDYNLNHPDNKLDWRDMSELMLASSKIQSKIEDTDITYNMQNSYFNPEDKENSAISRYNETMNKGLKEQNQAITLGDFKLIDGRKANEVEMSLPNGEFGNIIDFLNANDYTNSNKNKSEQRKYTLMTHLGETDQLALKDEQTGKVYDIGYGNFQDGDNLKYKQNSLVETLVQLKSTAFTTPETKKQIDMIANSLGSSTAEGNKVKSQIIAIANNQDSEPGKVYKISVNNDVTEITKFTDSSNQPKLIVTKYYVDDKGNKKSTKKVVTPDKFMKDQMINIGLGKAGLIVAPEVKGVVTRGSDYNKNKRESEFKVVKPPKNVNRYVEKVNSQKSNDSE